MAENFSFSVTDIEHIISNTGNLVPGIARVLSVYYSEKLRKVKAIEVVNPFMPRNFCEIPVDDKTLEEIETIRNENTEYFWHTSKDIPFVAETKKIKQLDVFDETDRHILLVTLKSEFDNKNDLIYYYFNKNLGNFKPSDTETPMDQNNKTIIGLFLFNIVNLLAKNCRNDRGALKTFNNDVRKIVYSLRNNEGLNENHYNSLINYVNDILADLSSKSGTHHFELSDSAKTKLKNYTGELKALNKIIKNASAFAANMNIGITDIPVKIEDFHLDFGNNTVSENQPSVRMDESKYDKIILWLDKLEDAAHVAMQNKLALTGVNIGRSFKRPISAAAISDFLSNNHSKIRTVMEKNKDNWPIVRSEFRPLINVLISKKHDPTMLSKQA